MKYSYDNQNLLTGIEFNSKRTSLEYDTMGNILKKTLPNGITISYTYNGSGRITEIKNSLAKAIKFTLIKTLKNSYILGFRNIFLTKDFRRNIRAVKIKTDNETK